MNIYQIHGNDQGGYIVEQHYVGTTPSRVNRVSEPSSGHRPAPDNQCGSTASTN